MNDCLAASNENIDYQMNTVRNSMGIRSCQSQRGHRDKMAGHHSRHVQQCVKHSIECNEYSMECHEYSTFVL